MRKSERRSFFPVDDGLYFLGEKFNDHTAIDTPAVRKLLQEKNIVPMRADWTNANPEITAALKKFGRGGVPFHVIYPAGNPGHPIVLPELLTESNPARRAPKTPLRRLEDFDRMNKIHRMD